MLEENRVASQNHLSWIMTNEKFPFSPQEQNEIIRAFILRGLWKWVGTIDNGNAAFKPVSELQAEG